jgi:hypothetical protein
MIRKLNLKQTAGLAAAFALAGLTGPAWSQEPVRYFSPECARYFTEVYCVANWQAAGFASQSACADYHRDVFCWFTTHY